MTMNRRLLSVCAPVALVAGLLALQPGPRPYAEGGWPLPASHPVLPHEAWTHGPWHEPGFFPIGVWLQNPANAERYQEAGINTYVGLWQGPTEEQLAALDEAGMWVICDQNEVGLDHVEDNTIIGWLQHDEPDNAQPEHDPVTGEMTGYGPPVRPEDVVARYEEMKEKDPSRPVLLNLGQGLANPAWVGRGSEGRPEDYATYVWGGDILSFDIYPVTNTRLPEGGHELWYVAKGLDRLRALSENERILWSVLECTHIGNADAIASPHEIRAQAWMSIIHGATGIVWFVHEFAPAFQESALLARPEQLEAVTAVNAEITGLAEVLRSPTVPGLATVESQNPRVPVDLMCKDYGGFAYLFAVAMEEEPTDATFAVTDIPPGARIEVLGEDRALRADGGVFTDHFEGWGVHVYRVAKDAGGPEPEGRG
ncbi:MAG: hypothetical protein GF320_13320 [Armatimonadia bacterium]|nr:hypothetical protein [Armatimonadia bacterium]